MERKSEKILRWKQVRERVGLCRVTVYGMIRKGKFPPPVRISTQTVGWRESDLDRWIRGCEQVRLRTPEPGQTTASQERGEPAALTDDVLELHA